MRLIRRFVMLAIIAILKDARPDLSADVGE